MIDQKIVFLQTDAEPSEVASALQHIPVELGFFFLLLPLKDKLMTKQDLLELIQRLPERNRYKLRG